MNHQIEASEDEVVQVEIKAANHKTRGTAWNPPNRFQSESVNPVLDDEWAQFDVPQLQQDELQQASAKAEIIVDRSKTIISTNQSPDLPFRQSINPYRGCEHGCVYCYARPSHAYWDLSAGLDFETKIIVKPNAAPLLKARFEQPKYVCETIMIGANTDPYQPVEIEQKTTRALLKVMQAYRHPFSIITKSSLILRDIDILAEMAENNLCSVAVSVTTLSKDLKRQLEPRTASPQARLNTIKTLSDAGIDVTLMAAPMIPAINDHELEDILSAGKEAGAKAATYIFLRLPREVDVLFETWLREYYPDRADHVLNLVMQSRGGKRYQADFKQRMRGQGVFANLLQRRFEIHARKLGLDRTPDYRSSLDVTQFLKPNDPAENQLSLF